MTGDAALQAILAGRGVFETETDDLVREVAALCDPAERRILASTVEEASLGADPGSLRARLAFVAKRLRSRARSRGE